jgi:hypothetical protein
MLPPFQTPLVFPIVQEHIADSSLTWWTHSLCPWTLMLQAAQYSGVLPFQDSWHANHEIPQLVGATLPGWVEIVPGHWLPIVLSQDPSRLPWDNPDGLATFPGFPGLGYFQSRHSQLR